MPSHRVQIVSRLTLVHRCASTSRFPCARWRSSAWLLCSIAPTRSPMKMPNSRSSSRILILKPVQTADGRDPHSCGTCANVISHHVGPIHRQRAASSRAPLDLGSLAAASSQLSCRGEADGDLKGDDERGEQGSDGGCTAGSGRGTSRLAGVWMAGEVRRGNGKEMERVVFK